MTDMLAISAELPVFDDTELMLQQISEYEKIHKANDDTDLAPGCFSVTPKHHWHLEKVVNQFLDALSSKPHDKWTRYLQPVGYTGMEGKRWILMLIYLKYLSFQIDI